MKRFLLVAAALCLLYSCADTTQAQTQRDLCTPPVVDLGNGQWKTAQLYTETQCPGGNCQGGACTVPAPSANNGGWRANPTPAWRYERNEGRYRSVVRVMAQESGRSRSYGSGCVIRWGVTPVIFTAKHVVGSVKEVMVRGKTRWHKCFVYGGDTDFDAVILVPLNDPGEDFDATQIAYKDTGTFKPGDRLESCGFGPDDRLVVNSGRVLGFGLAKPGLPPDWLRLSGRAREGDSGGPVLNDQGELVGVLWGTNDEEVIATQCGRLHVILKHVLGPLPKGEAKRHVILERPLVPVEPTSSLAEVQVGLFRNDPPSGACLGGLCRPTQPEPPPAPQQPNIVVQADPRVGDSLERIDGKLDTVVQNTTPLPPPVEEEEEEKEKPPVFALLAALTGVVVGFVVYFAAQKGN